MIEEHAQCSTNVYCFQLCPRPLAEELEGVPLKTSEVLICEILL